MSSPKDLPIYALEREVTEALARHGRLVLQAPTGSGKSTQVPQMLFEAGFADRGEIMVLQPRRLATRMLAARVAAERGEKLGGTVGYQIRLDRVASERTRIRFVTEGIMLRQMLADRLLRGVSTIIFDEFHERHLYGDISLARAMEIQEERADLKVIVMSATLDTGILANYLKPCAVLTSEGRTFPVSIDYLPTSADSIPVWDLAAEEFDRVAGHEPGDALIFMPGAYEIQRTIQALRNTTAGSRCVVLPLHGELPPAEQDAAVASYSGRKVIVSTNVAETSLTIDGVRLVIDSGLARVSRFDPFRGINTLLVEKISRASADQRAGRAGRTAAGRCLRLWTEREHFDRPTHESPEVKRLDLAEVALTLKASGVRDIRKFRWLESPDPRSLDRAERLLLDLGAIQEAEPSDNGTEITELGRRMLAFPAHPRYARMLLAANEFGCVQAACQVAALSQGRSILLRSTGKAMDQQREDLFGEEAESDFLILMRAMRYAEQQSFRPERLKALGIHGGAAREAAALAQQFLKVAKDEGLDTTSPVRDAEALLKCVLAGFPDQVAKRLDTGTLRCAMVHGRKGTLARDSAVREAPLIVASEVREVDGRDGVQTLLTLATAVKEPWLREMFPHAFADLQEAVLDPTQKRVISRHITRFHDLELRAERSDKASADDASRLLAARVAAGDLQIEAWDHAVEQWILRLNQLADWWPEFEIPKIGTDDRALLIEQVCHGAFSYSDVRSRAVWPTLKSWLASPQLKLVEDYAPERYELPGGRKAKITYSENAAPFLAARIQDFYGVTGELRIAGGRVPLVLHVLAPNQRPVQITTNLTTFWAESYPKLKVELSRKYPRHEWR